MSSSFRTAADRALPAVVVRRLDALGTLAARLEIPLLLVGGAVRDVLLGRATRDVDLVTVGDSAALLRALPEAVGEVAVTTSRLLTHRLHLADGSLVELGRARRETYAAPAALPDVSPGSLEDDLARRDVSINALAVPLGETWGRVIDLHGGQEDLRRGVLRTLHAASFSDDPTRLLRGIELAVRLDFRFAAETAGEARAALERGVLDALSPARLRAAWARCFGRLLRRDAAATGRAVALAGELGLDRALGAAFALPDPDAMERLAAALAPAADGVDEEAAGRAVLRWLAAGDGDLAGQWARRWELAADAVEAWSSFPRRAAALREVLPRGESWPTSLLDAAMTGFDAEERALLAAWPSAAFADVLDRWQREVSGFTLGVRGGDLVARGFAPGPAIGRVLAEVRSRRLDGELSRADELEYACRRLEESAT